MFSNSKDKIKSKWGALGCKYMAEHDRVYDVLVSRKLSSVDKESSNYLSGKFLFRSFATSFIQVGIILENKRNQSGLNQSDFDEVHEMLSMMSMEGTNDIFAVFETEHSIKLDKIPLDKLGPLHGRGAEFMDETVRAFAVYFSQTDINDVSDELVKLYCEALKHCIKDLDEKSMVPQAMATFSGARKAITNQI